MCTTELVVLGKAGFIKETEKGVVGFKGNVIVEKILKNGKSDYRFLAVHEKWPSLELCLVDYNCAQERETIEVKCRDIDVIETADYVKIVKHIATYFCELELSVSYSIFCPQTIVSVENKEEEL